jgi:hypothetical protein
MIYIQIGILILYIGLVVISHGISKLDDKINRKVEIPAGYTVDAIKFQGNIYDDNGNEVTPLVLTLKKKEDVK